MNEGDILLSSSAPIPIQEIKAAHSRIKDHVIRTPLVRLNLDDTSAEIYLKLENLQPIGAFKLRGVLNTIRLASEDQLADGVWTVSSGNTAQAVAWCAKLLGLRCTVGVMEYSSEIKLAAIKRLGAKIIKLSTEEIYEILLTTPEHEHMKGLFVNPFNDPRMMAGNGTISLEILEDLPQVDTVIAPWGGGGLSCGIASAFRSLKPEVKIYASEVETGAPLNASLSAGEPVEVEHSVSFVDGIGAPIVHPEMFTLAKQLLKGSYVVTLNEVTSAIKIIADRNHVIAEGAAATPVAAALSGKAGSGKVVCVISGGNIDSEKVAKILQGKTP